MALQVCPVLLRSCLTFLLCFFWRLPSELDVDVPASDDDDEVVVVSLEELERGQLCLLCLRLLWWQWRRRARCRGTVELSDVVESLSVLELLLLRLVRCQRRVRRGETAVVRRGARWCPFFGGERGDLERE